MSAADILSAGAELLFGRLGRDGWLTKTTNARSQINAVVTVPGAIELDGQASQKLDPRFIELATSTGAATGDLVTVNGTTWILGGPAEPDTLGLSKRWTGTPLGQYPTLAFSYHASGYPLVTYTAGAWTTP